MKPSYYLAPGLKDKSKLNPLKEVIVREVCQQYDVSFEALKSYNREPDLVFPRQLLMFLLRKKANLSLPLIGKFLKRDHTTILHGVRAIEKYIDSDSDGRKAEILSLY